MNLCLEHLDIDSKELDGQSIGNELRRVDFYSKNAVLHVRMTIRRREASADSYGSDRFYDAPARKV